MRISDWSSDVCSSDLHSPHQNRERLNRTRLLKPRLREALTLNLKRQKKLKTKRLIWRSRTSTNIITAMPTRRTGRCSIFASTWPNMPNRKRGASGTSGYVRVDLGGGGIIKKKK